ncbi:MAG: phosphoglycerate dehydrogenase [Bdellovibrionales bacterium]
MPNLSKNVRAKVLLLENIHPVALQAFDKELYDIEVVAGSLSASDLKARLKGINVLGIRSKTHLTSDILSSADSLWSVGAFCIGTNQIHLDYANQVGIPVFNAPYSNTRSVAELIIGELVALSRQLGDRNSAAHKQIWDKSVKGSREVRGKTLGIVGYGHIGSQVSVLAEALGLKVIFYDIVRKLPLGNSKQMESMDELLRSSDFVTIHVPETPQTMGLFSEKEFKKMKKGSHFLNASRGMVVNIPHLAVALKSGHIAGAALDVFPEEPLTNEDIFKSELQGLPNVILTPHIGGSTEEAQEAIGREVSDALATYLKRGSTVGSVNFPKVDMPATEGCHRILNVHQNTPGVLRDINKIVSDLGANIRAQSLSTDSKIGYLLMDMEKSDAEAAAEAIGRLKTSIKTRTLF